MKKFLAAVSVLTVILALSVSCAKKDTAQGTSQSAAQDAAQQKQGGKPTIMLITDATGIDDKSFNAAAWRGILEYYGDTWESQKGRGTQYNTQTCQTQDAYVPTIKQASEQGYDIIMVTGFTFMGALAEVAPQYPKQNYAIVDVSGIGQPNVMEFLFTEEQGSYLVGVAAALKAQEDQINNPRFGFIGGVPGATITKFEMGYIQGVRSVIPDAPIVDYYANDWGAPDKAKTQAKNWYDAGVYMIYSAAGGTGLGTIAQAKEYRTQNKNVWTIGVDSDQYEDGVYSGTKSAVITSMIKRVEAASLYALDAMETGTFKGGAVFINMSMNGVDFAKTNPELSPAIITKVEAVKSDIVAGSVKVAGTYKEALAQGLAPAGLGAKDD
jgi:basic membrane protein A